MAPNIGAKTNEYKRDPTRTQNTVIGISLIKAPNPGMNISGVKAIKVVVVEESTGQNILVAAAVYASILFIPSASFLSAYSVTTMEPSIVMPIEISIPNMTIKLNSLSKIKSTRRANK